MIRERFKKITYGGGLDLKSAAAPVCGTMTDTETSATTIDLSADPYDLSPAIDHIVTTAKDALAADQKVILMLGEEHGTITDVRMAELVHRGLQQAGIENPVIATETPHNFVEFLLPRFFPDNSHSTFRAQAAQALSSLKAINPARYRHLQSLTFAACMWTLAPVTRLENSSSWQDKGLDVRPIDMAKTRGDCLDYADRTAKNFIDANASPSIKDKSHILTNDEEGVRLRNKWMAMQLQSISVQNRVTILQTGSTHLGGAAGIYPYPDSLHGILAMAANNNMKIISLFPENHGDTFKNFLPRAAKNAMNNPDTIILCGQDETQHWRNRCDLFEDEIKTLTRISGPSFRPRIRTEYDYHALRGEYEQQLKNEIRAATEEFTPLMANKFPR